MSSISLSNLIKRSNGICHLCGKKTFGLNRPSGMHHDVWNAWRPTRDHVIPRNEGGNNTLSNIRLAHAACNKARSSDSVSFYKMLHLCMIRFPSLEFKKHYRGKWYNYQPSENVSYEVFTLSPPIN